MNPLLLIVPAMFACGGTFAAQPSDSFPSKPIRIVVPQPPGGTTDAAARLFASKMTELLGQQIVIDNRAGGGVAGLGVQSMVAHSNPDGYTMLAIVPNFTFTPALVKNMPVKPEDFAPVTLMSRDPYVLSIYPGIPAKSVKEFIAYAKSRTDGLNMGSGNIGSGTHLVSMFFLNEAGLRSHIAYVPYKGSGIAFTDLMAGRLQAGISSIVSAGPHIKSGRLRALGLTSQNRSPEWPDLPTIMEQGLPGFEASAWYGLAVPAKTPVAVINKVAAAAGQAAKAQEVSSRIRALGGEAVGSSAAEFRQLIDREIPRWTRLIKDIGMTGTVE